MNTGKLHIPKIVITGGPCGGKSSAMPFLHERLTTLGYYPIIIPEIPTLLMNAGCSPHGGIDKLLQFQGQVLDCTLSIEDDTLRFARAHLHPKPVIVADRGLMDIKAYTPEDKFVEMLYVRDLDHPSTYTDRYHAVFHMQSAAIGAEEYYTTANNAVRFETLDEARLADTRTLAAWSSHPHLVVIANEGKSFDQKLETLWGHVRQALC